MIFRYISIGTNLSHNAGVISYFHDKCAVHFNAIGVPAERYEGSLPKYVRCRWCGKPVEAAMK